MGTNHDSENGDSDSNEPTKAIPPWPVTVFNVSMTNLAEVAGRNIERLDYQLESWDDSSELVKETFLRKAKQACQLVCEVMAPQDGEKLFNVVQQQQRNEGTASDPGLEALVAAYRKAPSKALKTQILSIYANKLTARELKSLHRPFEKLSDRQIKKARTHAASQGPGIPVTKIPHHRIRLDKFKLDHFLEFTSRPYFYQDVAFGSRKLKLDSGQELVMPNIVRTVAKCTIISQYLDYCRDDNFEPLSRATMWRVLEVQEASQRKSLKGLDNTAADGADGFEVLHKTLNELEDFGADKEWCSETKKRLREGKLYLKTTYRDHCQEESKCPDHCRAFALSDSNNTDYRTVCSHSHDHVCHDCEALKEVIQDIQSAIGKCSSKINDKEKENDLRYQADAAAAKIREWKAHVMRAQNQEQNKQKVLRSLQEDEVLVVVDWAMKFIPMKFREKQSEWYGKRGINWHISSVIIRQAERLKITSYAHLFNSCSQDWFSVLSILENLLSIIKGSNPGITKAYFRSDEAGCYHNSCLISSLRDLGKRQGIEVVRYDHSEPQHGKDVCDRILCPMKATIRRYCNEGHDVITAEDMHEALMKRSIRGTTAAVCCINEANTTLKIKKIPNYSSLHNFELTPDGVRTWKASDVGNGKLFSWDSIIQIPQGATGLTEKQAFFSTSAREMDRTAKKSRDNDMESTCFECPDPQCTEEFKSRAELDIHLDVIGHHTPVEPASVGLYDQLRLDWVERFQAVSLSDVKTSHTAAEEQLTPAETDSSEMGWALHKPRSTQTRFPEKVRNYLRKKFKIGQETGRKEDPAQVADDMRKARKADGERMFSRTEWLSKQQIQGFFSRLSARQRQSGSNEFTRDEDSDELDDETAEEYACREDEKLLDEINDAVMSSIGVIHPVVYDVYNLCEMAKEKKLSSFKVKMLREICDYFEIRFRVRDTKAELVKKLNEMVLNCTCMSSCSEL